MPGLCRQPRSFSSFNPRPPSLAGVALASSASRRSTLFQSAPAIAGGRCPAGVVHRRAGAGFNPRPPSLAGVACTARPVASRLQGFNPRPPSLAGVAGRDSAHHGLECVSIRARHRWRALRHDLACAVLGRLVSIRARHRWRALRSISFNSSFAGLFQSAPAIAGGRCRFGSYCLSVSSGFNPRPPSLAGVAVEILRTMGLNVFQSAPAIAGGRCAKPI